MLELSVGKYVVLGEGEYSNLYMVILELESAYRVKKVSGNITINTHYNIDKKSAKIVGSDNQLAIHKFEDIYGKYNHLLSEEILHIASFLSSVKEVDLVDEIISKLVSHNYSDEVLSDVLHTLDISVD